MTAIHRPSSRQTPGEDLMLKKAIDVVTKGKTDWLQSQGTTKSERSPPGLTPLNVPQPRSSARFDSAALRIQMRRLRRDLRSDSKVCRRTAHGSREMRGAVQRLISAPALQFKGSGWYVNDYAKAATAAPRRPRANRRASQNRTRNPPQTAPRSPQKLKAASQNPPPLRATNPDVAHALVRAVFTLV